jgi:hypothetical protein
MWDTRVERKSLSLPVWRSRNMPVFAHQIGVRAEVEVEVTPHAAAGEDAEAAGEALGRMAGILERLPGGFEELPVLRVHDRRVLGREPEEIGVEPLEAIEGGGRRNVVGLLHASRAFTRCAEFFLRQPPYRLPPLAQEIPVLLDGGRTRQVRRHPHDGDIRLGNLSENVRHVHDLRITSFNKPGGEADAHTGHRADPYPDFQLKLYEENSRKGKLFIGGATIPRSWRSLCVENI